MATTQHLTTILDNNVLDSSMGSTQGLLSFMTNASRQIKTYLGPDDHKKSQKKQRRQQLLLQHLTQLKTQNFNFIPDILKSPDFGLHSSPASPTPSLDSVGSYDDEDTPSIRSSCLLSNRRKRSRGSISNENVAKRMRQNSFDSNISLEYDVDSIIPSINTSCMNHSSSIVSSTIRNHSRNNINDSDNFDDTIVPSPSPDFDDLVDCMLTEDSLSKIDVNNYFPSL